MYYCPYQNQFRNPDPAPEAHSFYRLLHASPEAPAVDVYINGSLAAPGLKYAHFTSYFRAPAGSYDVKVYPAGKKDKPVIEAVLQLAPGTIYTVAAIGNLNNLSLMPISEPPQPQARNHASIRFIHLSPNTPAVDITLPDGKVLFSNVRYKDVTDYISVPQGHYTVQARAAGTDKVVLIVPNIHLLPNKIFSIYAIGKLNGKPPLQVLIPLDGSTYLR
ncbi:MAG: DUF4397 domain-containing protein [Bacillota bacterium]|nr:DUF4397 domain-containing protein [Bacillota bacterium]